MSGSSSLAASIGCLPTIAAAAGVELDQGREDFHITYFEKEGQNNKVMGDFYIFDFSVFPNFSIMATYFFITRKNK